MEKVVSAMYSTKIKALNDEYNELVEFCRANQQVSFEMYIDNTYKKSLLLSAASFFEVIIINAIHDYAVATSHQNATLVAFLDNKALKRQYHTFFSWEGNNTNQFWGLFGDAFKAEAKTKIKEKNLEEAETAFITIGRERNYLVHNNYIEAVVNYTFKELYSKYLDACNFVELITQLFAT